MTIILLDNIDVRSQLFVLDPNPRWLCASCLSGNQYFIYKDVLNCGFFIIDFIFGITKIIENLQVSYCTANGQIIVNQMISTGEVIDWLVNTLQKFFIELFDMLQDLDIASSA